jgi:hypothetical protein
VDSVSQRRPCNITKDITNHPSCRIEGSSIIIASSIPLLQPLVEVIFGRGVFSSASKGRRYYEDYSSQNGHLASAYAGKKSRTGTKPGPYGDVELTARNLTASEEEILGPVEKKTVIDSKGQARDNKGSQGIRRTDSFTVSYNSS